jgi:hypothetical protein
VQGGGNAGGAGSSFPVAGIMGERRPLAPFLHGFLGILLHENGIHGGGKNVAFGGCNSCEGVPHELDLLPLYSFLDFRHPI